MQYLLSVARVCDPNLSQVLVLHYIAPLHHTRQNNRTQINIGEAVVHTTELKVNFSLQQRIKCQLLHNL